jgi:hypothetical protein
MKGSVLEIIISCDIKLKYVISLKGLKLKVQKRKIIESKTELHKYIIIKLSDGEVIKQPQKLCVVQAHE